MNKQIKISEIPKDYSYIGYLWMSGSNRPITNNFADVLNDVTDNSNPFIVEGQLYSEKEQKSYNIRYVDGNHIVVEYNLKDTSLDYDEKLFIPNRLDGVEKIKFRYYWRIVNDEFCESMATLVPAGYVFTGFEYNNKKEEGK
ncbi:hypothetical protein AGMMS49574_05380 [Bacteroidia bacterium]|nr:hypothetical protein AGMMS49574_05380 [Bacteroidia bacterium]